MVDHDEIRLQHGYHPLRVQGIVQETADTRSFVLDVPAEFAPLYEYRAGQFCTFRVQIDDEEYMRCYSMSSAPETDADLTVTVKRVPGGMVSNWLNDFVSEGDVLEATKPAGVFCLGDAQAPVIAFCGGSGVTPVMSIIKSALASTQRTIRVLYANRNHHSVIFRAELEQLQTEHPSRLEVRHHLDADGGFLEAADIDGFVGDTAEADFYICGPPPFMDLVETTLLDNGVTSDRILLERFDHTALPEPPVAEAAATESAVPETVTVILKGQQHTIAYQAGDTLLETARRGGLQPPYSCESGNCATCMALLHEGSVTMRANNALTPEEVDEGWVLTCQGLPRGDTVTVEYESF